VTIAALILSLAAVIVSGCQVYWTLRLRKARRKLTQVSLYNAEQMAARAAAGIVPADGLLTEAELRKQRRIHGAWPY
jgi:hypothetical protein